MRRKKRKKLVITIIVMMVINLGLAYGILVTYNNSEYAELKSSLQPELQIKIDNPAASVPVIVYHNICAEKHAKSIKKGRAEWTTDTDFAREMEYLAEHGYVALHNDEMQMWQQGEIEVPEKSVYIMFEDARYNSLEYAAPILERTGMYATLYVTGSTVTDKREKDKADSPYTWAELENICETSAVMEIQSQSYDMNRKSNDAPVIKIMSSRNIEDDIDKQDAAFEKVGIYMTSFAIPYGESSKELIQSLEDYGYELAIVLGANERATQNDKQFKVPGISIDGSKSVEDGFISIFEGN